MLNKRLSKAFDENNGILTPRLAKNYGISNEALRKAALRGDIIREERGIYLRDSSSFDDLYINQLQYSKGIYSHDTAVMLHNLSTFSPFRYKMTFPNGYNLNRNKAKLVEPYFVVKELYEIGIEQIKSWHGNTLLVTNKERTVIDMLRSKRTMPGVTEEMIESYLYFEEPNFELLMKYAKVFHIEKKVEEKVLSIAE